MWMSAAIANIVTYGYLSFNTFSRIILALQVTVFYTFVTWERMMRKYMKGVSYDIGAVVDSCVMIMSQQ